MPYSRLARCCYFEMTHIAISLALASRVQCLALAAQLHKLAAHVAVPSTPPRLQKTTFRPHAFPVALLYLHYAHVPKHPSAYVQRRHATPQQESHSAKHVQMQSTGMPPRKTRPASWTLCLLPSRLGYYHSSYPAVIHCLSSDLTSNDFSTQRGNSAPRRVDHLGTQLRATRSLLLVQDLPSPLGRCSSQFGGNFRAPLFLAPCDRHCLVRHFVETVTYPHACDC